MNLSKWTARVSNWKKQDAREKPLEYHIAHLHSEVSELFEVVRGINHGKQGAWQAPEGITTESPFAHVWYGKDGHPEGFGIELADVILVALFIASVTGIDIEKQMELKMQFNESKRAAR